VDERTGGTLLDSPGLGRRALPLRCQTRQYAWGGYDFIPDLIGRANPDREPVAELWVGAHPALPSTVALEGANVPLNRLIGRAPDALLGPEVAARFGPALPYLLKVLDVRAMLSIQTHPGKQRAEEGFTRETEAGIPLDAPHRNYRDGNHKPEATVALTDFWMLYGFKPLEAIADTLDAVRELRPLAPDFRSRLASAGRDRQAREAVLRTLYEHVMTSQQPLIDRVLEPLLVRLTAPGAHGELQRSSPDFWAVRAGAQFPIPAGHLDRGIISIYLLNLMCLQPGQAVFIPAGLLHAHLEGAAIEIMANSDNVLRGGLTPKHVDVPELLRAVMFKSAPPAVFVGERVSPVEARFGTPSVEFELSRLDLAPGQPFVSPGAWGADTLLVLDGRAELRTGTDTMPMARGAAVLIPNGLAYQVHAGAPATIFRASVPHPL
jgi:mannose-6-phosphate isomerase class I